VEKSDVHAFTSFLGTSSAHRQADPRRGKLHAKKRCQRFYFFPVASSSSSIGQVCVRDVTWKKRRPNAPNLGRNTNFNVQDQTSLVLWKIALLLLSRASAIEIVSNKQRGPL
jgi:hypothetical protein